MGFKDLFKKKQSNEALRALALEIVGKMASDNIVIDLPARELSLAEEIKASNLLVELLAIDIKNHYWYDAAIASNQLKDQPQADPELYNFSFTYNGYINEFVNVMDELKKLGIQVII